jgi:hypothetical protein
MFSHVWNLGDKASGVHIIFSFVHFYNLRFYELQSYEEKRVVVAGRHLLLVIYGLVVERYFSTFCSCTQRLTLFFSEYFSVLRYNLLRYGTELQF